MARTKKGDDSTKGRGWHGDPQGHSDAGRKGGEARKAQMAKSGQSYEELGRKGGEAAQRSGSAHRLTDEERSRGGQHSHLNDDSDMD